MTSPRIVLSGRGPKLEGLQWESDKLLGIGRQRSVDVAAILEPISSLRPMIPIVRHHHDRWDGNGYPDRLGKTDIALIARIVGVADAFDAMTQNRPYRAAMHPEVAFLEVLKQAGTHFDPQCVQAFLRQRSKVEQLLVGK